MIRKKHSVASIAREAGLEFDEALIELWDGGFDKINSPEDLLTRGEANRARRLFGLATRRELGSQSYWTKLLGVNKAQLDELLGSLSVDRPYAGSKLTKRAIHRLKSEGRNRGLLPSYGAARQDKPKTKVVPPLRWSIVGHKKEMSYLTVDQLVDFHEILIKDYEKHEDPILPAGVKNQGLLESAVYRSEQVQEKYPTVEMAAAGLLHGLVHNHPFHNGNKRTALVSMLVFMDENGLLLTCDEAELFQMVLQLARHALPGTGVCRGETADREVQYVAKWIKKRSRLVTKGDRPLPWRRLKKILREYDCSTELASGVGNRMNIRRSVLRKGSLLRGRRKSELLTTQIYYSDPGCEISRNTVHKIRKELELDDMHGVDSAMFYDNAPAAASGFVVLYRKTLNRLAKM